VKRIRKDLLCVCQSRPAVARGSWGKYTSGLHRCEFHGRVSRLAVSQVDRAHVEDLCEE
jgi:hypothetical protein